MCSAAAAALAASSGGRLASQAGAPATVHQHRQLLGSHRGGKKFGTHVGEEPLATAEEERAGDEACPIGGKKGHQVGHVFGLGDAAQWGRLATLGHNPGAKCF